MITGVKLDRSVTHRYRFEARAHVGADVAEAARFGAAKREVGDRLVAAAGDREAARAHESLGAPLGKGFDLTEAGRVENLFEADQRGWAIEVVVGESAEQLLLELPEQRLVFDEFLGEGEYFLHRAAALELEIGEFRQIGTDVRLPIAERGALDRGGQQRLLGEISIHIRHSTVQQLTGNAIRVRLVVRLRIRM